MNRIEIPFVEPMSIVSDAPRDKAELPESLQKRNQTALGTLIDHSHTRLLQLAKMFVPNETEAEEVVQELGVKILEGVQKDEGRSCLEVLIFQILTKRSQTSQVQENWGKYSSVH